MDCGRTGGVCSNTSGGQILNQNGHSWTNLNYIVTRLSAKVGPMDRLGL